MRNIIFYFGEVNFTRLLNKDKTITIDELYEYISENVVKVSKNYGGNQHPLKKGETTGKFVILTY